MADKTVPVTYRKGKLRAGGLGSLAKAKDGSSGQFYIYGNNGPELTDLQSLLDSVFGSTRGSIIYRGASGWAKLDPGTSGLVLASNGAGADPSYQDKSGSLKFISAQTASNSSSLDFTSGINSTYSNYEFVIENLVPGTDLVVYYVLYSTDAGANWLSSNYITSGGGSTDTHIQITAVTSVSNISNSGLSGKVILYSPASGSTNTWLRSSTVHRQGVAPNGAVSSSVGGSNTTTSAINGIRFIPSSGNFASGTIRMYGLKGS